MAHDLQRGGLESRVIASQKKHNDYIAKATNVANVESLKRKDRDKELRSRSTEDQLHKESNKRLRVSSGDSSSETRSKSRHRFRFYARNKLTFNRRKKRATFFFSN